MVSCLNGIVSNSNDSINNQKNRTDWSRNWSRINCSNCYCWCGCHWKRIGSYHPCHCTNSNQQSLQVPFWILPSVVMADLLRLRNSSSNDNGDSSHSSRLHIHNNTKSPQQHDWNCQPFKSSSSPSILITILLKTATTTTERRRRRRRIVQIQGLGCVGWIQGCCELTME